MTGKKNTIGKEEMNKVVGGGIMPPPFGPICPDNPIIPGGRPIEVPDTAPKNDDTIVPVKNPTFYI